VPFDSRVYIQYIILSISLICLHGLHITKLPVNSSAGKNLYNIEVHYYQRIWQNEVM